MIKIEKELCIGCGSCVKDCPARAIKLEDQKASWVRDCIHCGHCVAVCPTKAVAIPEYDMDDVEEYNKETFHVDPEHFLHALKFRRSIRNYKHQPIEKDKLERIINAGRYTATAKNVQACKFVVVQDCLEEFKKLVWEEMPNVIETLKEINPDYAKAFSIFQRWHEKDPANDTFFFNTPAFLVVTSDYNPLDGGLASANIENMAVAEGLGVLYSGYMMRVVSASPVLQKWLGIEGKHIASCMLMGYPAVSYKRTAPRRKANVEWR